MVLSIALSRFSLAWARRLRVTQVPFIGDNYYIKPPRHNRGVMFELVISFIEQTGLVAPSGGRLLEDSAYSVPMIPWLKNICYFWFMRHVVINMVGAASSKRVSRLFYYQYASVTV